jgi:hypothetical protein
MPYWAAVRTVRNHDRLAAGGVALAGFETFIPRIRVKVGARWRTTPLSGCYFFVRVVARWRILERTMGVLSVGSGPRWREASRPSPCLPNVGRLYPGRAGN